MMEHYLAGALRFGEPLPIGIGHLALGLVHGEDREQLEQALDAVLRDSQYRWFAARAALELGAAMRRDARRRRRRASTCATRWTTPSARARRRSASARARSSGSPALRPRRERAERRRGPDAGEERIARLAAEGRSPTRRSPSTCS